MPGRGGISRAAPDDPPSGSASACLSAAIPATSAVITPSSWITSPAKMPMAT